MSAPTPTPTPIKHSGPSKYCHHCDHDIYPNGKILLDYPADNAVRDKNGGWKCADCVKEYLNHDIIRHAPNSLAAKEIIAARKRKEDFKARYERAKNMTGKRFAY